MIDKQLFKIDGAGSILKKLAGLEILQAFFIVGQALALGTSVSLKQIVGRSTSRLATTNYFCSLLYRQTIDQHTERFNVRKIFRSGCRRIKTAALK